MIKNMTSTGITLDMFGPRVWDGDWRVHKGVYACPVCGSREIAGERNETTRYPERTVTVERTIRCMDCGADDTEETTQ
jgi:YgiT-type zinc finger domain-containing protein